MQDQSNWIVILSNERRSDYQIYQNDSFSLDKLSLQVLHTSSQSKHYEVKFASSKKEENEHLNSFIVPGTGSGSCSDPDITVFQN